MARETGGLDLVVVDYLQLLQMESKENNRCHGSCKYYARVEISGKRLGDPSNCSLPTESSS